MKQGTLYAGRLKKAYAKIHKQTPVPETPLPTEPLHQLAIAAFAVSCGEGHAAKIVDSLLANMAGWNEVRVSRPAEVSKAIGKNGEHSLQERMEEGKVVTQESMIRKRKY